jgi:(1->4)-alpha-D-glucan 1-alpha-D-glucosylmutase
MHAYAEKAMREASDGTTWTEPDLGFEAAVHEAVDLAYDDPRLRVAWNQIDTMITEPGWVNSLGQKLVQLTMPGVPDVYQGTEVWDNSLVDPDNRRPVDFAALRNLLEAVRRARFPIDASGAAKLWVTHQALLARRDRAEEFTGYTPIEAVGPQADHLVAFDRGGAITLATRLPVGLVKAGGWESTELQLPSQVTDVLTGATFDGPTPVADLLSHYPVALLLPY